MITEKPQYRREMSPSLQFLTLIGITIVLVFLGSAIASFVIAQVYNADTLRKLTTMDLSTPMTVKAMWILQILSMTVPLLVLPFIFGKLVMKEPQAYLKLNFRFPLVLLMMVFSIMVMSTPIMEVLVLVNQKLVLPVFLSGLERWMRESEQSAQKVTAALLKMNDWVDLLKAVLLIGLVTAVAEELVFRGCLQTIFLRWTQNTHVAIWITAALFSAFHLEFFGFLPRLMLGVFFGYFAAWSGSIWPAVWAHFLNNASAVVITYLYQHKKIDVNPDEAHSFNYSLYVLSIIITVALFWSYRTAALQKKDHQQY
jgi:membrane protease YdiL (CAAX protease family)